MRKRFRIKVMLALLLGAGPAAFAAEPGPAEPSECEKVQTSLAAVCKGAEGTKITGQLVQACQDFKKDIDKLKAEYEASVTDCANKAKALNAAGGAKVTGAQAKAHKGAGELMQENTGALKECADKMAAQKKALQDLAEKSEKYRTDLNKGGLSGVSPECSKKVNELLKNFKDTADERAKKVDETEKQYTGAGNKTGDLKDGNQKNEKGMNGGGDKAKDNKGDEKKDGGGSGGGMPQMPQIPPKKKDTTAEDQAKKLQACVMAQAEFDRRLALHCDGQRTQICDPKLKNGCDKTCDQCIENCKNLIASDPGWAPFGVSRKSNCQLLFGPMATPPQAQ